MDSYYQDLSTKLDTYGFELQKDFELYERDEALEEWVNLRNRMPNNRWDMAQYWEFINRQDERHEDLPRWRTAWDALGDLETDEQDPALQPRGKWADLLPSIPEGQNYLYHTERGDGLALFGWRRRFWNFLLKLAKDRPSWTLTAQPGPATDPFHWRSRASGCAAVRPASENASRAKRGTPRRNTRAEMRLRRALWHRGLRYRLHAKDLPGKPDLVFRGVREGLQALIERESARRLARLGGSEPQLENVPRRRSKPA